MSDKEGIDLGSGFTLHYAGWAPDRSIEGNAIRYKDVPDIPRVAAILTCKHGTEGVIHFDVKNAREVFPSATFWTVESWEPLTISPSVDAGCCHGWIKNGKWVDA